MQQQNLDYLWRKGQFYSLLVGMWLAIFLERQCGGESQMLLKCAYVANLPLGIHCKELVSEKMFVQRVSGHCLN